MSTLKVTVKERTNKQGSKTLEGTYQLPSSTVTKLARKDGTTSFQNRATLNQTARRIADALGWKLEYNEPAKKAAKKSVKVQTKAKPKVKAKPKAKAKPKTTSSTATMTPVTMTPLGQF